MNSGVNNKYIKSKINFFTKGSNFFPDYNELRAQQKNPQFVVTDFDSMIDFSKKYIAEMFFFMLLQKNIKIQMSRVKILFTKNQFIKHV